MSLPRFHAFVIAAFIMGGVVGSYFGLLFSSSDRLMRQLTQPLNRPLTSLARTPQPLAPLLKWRNPPETNTPILWVLYAVLPPLAVALALGLWAKSVFWSLAQLPFCLELLQFMRPIDFRLRPSKDPAKS